ncbi:hypothetical protein J1N35_005375, partial [Gossypium stocksii]
DVFMLVQPSTRAPVIRELSDRLGLSYKRLIIKGKVKEITRSSKSTKDAQD